MTRKDSTMNKCAFLVFAILFFHLGAYAGQHLDSPVSISVSGTFASASGTLSDTYGDASSGAYFYCGLNTGALLCLGQDAEGDSFGCYLLSSSAQFAYMREIVLSMGPTDKFYMSATDSLCTNIQIYKDSRYAG